MKSQRHPYKCYNEKKTETRNYPDGYESNKGLSFFIKGNVTA